MREGIQYELRDAIEMYGPDCIVLMGDDDFVELCKRVLTIYQAGVAVAQGEMEYLGVRVLTNDVPGTSGFIIGDKESMEPCVSRKTMSGNEQEALKPFTLLVWDPARTGLVQAPVMAKDPCDAKLQWLAAQVRAEQSITEDVDGRILAIYEGHLENLVQ